MPEVCKKCGNTFIRVSCEFCIRLEQWENHRKDFYIQKHTPRIIRDLTQYKFDQEAVDTGLYFLNKDTSLYLEGAVGSKKTSYATYIALERLKQRHLNNLSCTYVFINSDTFDRQLKDTINNKDLSENAIIEKLSKVDVLFFDDIGLQKHSEWKYNAIYSLINYRYNHLLSDTIVTSNLSLEQLSKKWGDERVTSRIKGSYHVWDFGEKDYR